MTEDGIGKGQRFAIVHQAVARANAPQRRGANFIARGLSAKLYSNTTKKQAAITHFFYCFFIEKEVISGLNPDYVWQWNKARI